MAAPALIIHARAVRSAEPDGGHPLEQPKKPGAPGARDMTDLKARLGLNRGPAAGNAGPPPARSPFPSSPPGGAPFPGAPAAQFPPGPAGAPNPLGAPQPGPPSP